MRYALSFWPPVLATFLKNGSLFFVDGLSGMAASSPIRTTRDGERSPVAVSDPVLLQLARILASPAFCNSKRNKDFLRFIVEQTRLGHADSLKERLIGIEVFGRVPDYDLATDAIVRVAATEVRKRLAQYYVENAHAGELRIQLQPGSYVPEFNATPVPSPAGPSSSEAFQPQIPEQAELGHSVDRPHSHSILLNHFVLWGILAITILSVSGLLLYWVNRPSPIDQFWKPFIYSANAPVYCLGDLSSRIQLRNGLGTGLSTDAKGNDYLSRGDVEAMNRISRILIRSDKDLSILNSGLTTLADLRRQPAILIGGSTNQWTMRAMQFLRYQLVPNVTDGVNGIRDRKDGRILWTVDFNMPFQKVPKTYGILARFNDPTTGQPTVIIDGVGAEGTIAVADFLSTPSYFKEFSNGAPKDWQNRNFEIVLETQLINGDYGPPHVIQTYFW